MSAIPSQGGWHREAALFVSAIIGVAAVIAIFAVVSPASTTPGGPLGSAVPQGLSAFQSDSQLNAFISANAKSAQQYNRWGIGFGGPLAFGGGIKAEFGVAAPQLAAAANGASPSAPSFTTTNVQVQGVDEPDRVKTDGTHLFVSTQDSVSIINAPSTYCTTCNTTSILSSLTFKPLSVVGLEITQGRLMVIAQSNSYVPIYAGVNGVPSSSSSTPNVQLLLYDISVLTSPRLMENVTVPGTYVAARMADGYLYAVIQQPSYVFNGQGNATAVMPTASVGGVESQLPATSVYYANNTAQISYYTVIPSVSMSTGNETIQTVLTGPSATVYVSTSNIYVVYTNYLDVYDVDGIPGNAWSGGVITPDLVRQSQNSSILRAAYSNGSVSVAAAGVVPGTVLNQFSLDEYNSYFRIATSRFATVNGVATASDDIYVLDKSLSQVSSLKDIAPGENIYAVRFVGDMGYVVTYQQIDPLFVISFQDISNPAILSALKVSGYSDYLHPLPGGYLLGVGKESVPASDGNYSYYLGLKLSLFRIFDNGTSAQVSKMVIGDRGTDSPVLSDHLAFTFDSTRNVTVIPLTLYVVSGNQTYQGGIPAYGDPVWQGVYVIKVTPTGFTVLGKVSQYPAGQNFGDYPNGNLSIDRSVIIGNYLYTISQGEVMVSDISTFSTVATVQLPG